MYLSENLDNQKVYNRDGLKENYIMWKTPTRGGSKNKEKEKRKRFTVALRVLLAFRNSGSNNSSSPQTTFSSSFTGVSMFVLILNPC